MLVIISFSWQALPTQKNLLFGTQLQRTPVLFASSSRSNTKISLTYPATQAAIRWENSCSMTSSMLFQAKYSRDSANVHCRLKKLKKEFLINLQYPSPLPQKWDVLLNLKQLLDISAVSTLKLDLALTSHTFQKTSDTKTQDWNVNEGLPYHDAKNNEQATEKIGLPEWCCNL